MADLSDRQLSDDFLAVYRKMDGLTAAVGVKVIRAALRRTVRPVLNKLKAAAPVGSVGHRTYRKRLVNPGFTKRSVRYLTTINRAEGVVSAVMGVRKEAFYGLQFFDQGPYTVVRRRKAGGGRRGRKKSQRFTQVKPYTIPKRPWAAPVFVASRTQMETDFVTHMQTGIERAVRG